MRATKIVDPSRFLSLLALLFLASVCASAQQLADGWYKVDASELTVRNSLAKYVMGTLLLENSKGQPDRFYIRHMNPGSKWAWGYAQGEDFNGCGWVYTYRNKKERSLKRMSAQPPGIPSCSQYEKKRPYTVPESLFAAPLANGKYTNISPKTDGSGANISAVGGAEIFGNYVRGVPTTKLNRNASGVPQPLRNNYRVCWRFFTADRKYVMVSFKGFCRDSSSNVSTGKWGFVRCTAVKPDPKDRKDKARFESGRCVTQ